MTKVMKENDLPLPSDKLPECWFNNERMNSLYAPVRNRNVNPEDWKSKWKFWTKMISSYCIHHNICSFTLPDLKKAFKRDGRPPGCLQEVVEEMYKNGSLQVLQRFMQTPSETWTGWVTDLLVKQPIIWSYNKMKEKLVTTIDDTTVFVHIEAVQNISSKLLSVIPTDYLNKVIDFNQLTELIKNQNITNENLKLCLHYLRCQGKVAIKENYQVNETHSMEDLTLIKIADMQEKVTPISEIDLSIYNLERNEKLLIKAIEELEKEKEIISNEAKNYVKKEMRTMAKNCLRKKQTLEKNIEKRFGVLENLQILLSRLKETKHDNKVIESYKKGVNAYKNTIAEHGLTEDKVTDVIDDVKEMLQFQDELHTILGETVTETFDSDLEEELNELLEQTYIAEETDKTPIKETKPETRIAEAETELDEQYKDIERRLRALHTNLPALSPESMKKARISQ